MKRLMTCLTVHILYVYIRVKVKALRLSTPPANDSRPNSSLCCLEWTRPERVHVVLECDVML